MSTQTFTGAVSARFEIEKHFGMRSASIRQVLVNFSAAPTTSEVIILRTGGTEMPAPVELRREDPSDDSLTDISWEFTEGFPLGEDEYLEVVYPNTDSGTIQVTFKPWYAS